MVKNRILVVDDDESIRDSMKEWLGSRGYEVHTAADGYQAIERVKEEDWDLLLVDLKMPGIDGLEVLKTVNKIRKGLPVIIITAFATIDTAVVAMKEGAADYILKPFDPEELLIVIGKLIEHQLLIKENILLRQELTKRFNFQNLIGKSPKMIKIFDLIKTVAPTKSNILIKGESGTGKELVARAIHELSLRKEGPFIPINCGALPESLLEAELFGYEKGAFTGAVAQHRGRIEMADRGTLFLDEVGDISLKTQTDLLRFIQEREFMRLGGRVSIKVDLRIISATNKNIEELIKQGKFREDLYYRLNVITIEIPPLRDRKEDLPLLIEHFLTKFSLETEKEINRVSDDAMKLLLNYHWPGNVRQLENTIEHAVVISKGPQITISDLPEHLLSTEEFQEGDQSLEAIERTHILNILKKNNWNITRSAKILGINRLTLYNKIRDFDLKANK